ncbi:MAG TPA: DinB family protein, partial [Nocardioides sp.]|nr:DinB family protein [Nocardioides sp.]
MTPAELLTESLERVRESVGAVLDGLSPEELAQRPTRDANPIGWLVWHLTRVQDDHVADVAGTEQVWTKDGFAERFDLPYATATHGYGQTSEEVGQFRADADMLSAYYAAVHARSLEFLAGL